MWLKPNHLIVNNFLRRYYHLLRCSCFPNVFKPATPYLNVTVDIRPLCVDQRNIRLDSLHGYYVFPAKRVFDDPIVSILNADAKKVGAENPSDWDEWDSHGSSAKSIDHGTTCVLNQFQFPRLCCFSKI